MDFTFDVDLLDETMKKLGYDQIVNRVEEKDWKMVYEKWKKISEQIGPITPVPIHGVPRLWKDPPTKGRCHTLYSIDFGKLRDYTPSELIAIDMTLHSLLSYSRLLGIVHPKCHDEKPLDFLNMYKNLKLDGKKLDCAIELHSSRVKGEYKGELFLYYLVTPITQS